jgi:lysozyme
VNFQKLRATLADAEFEALSLYKDTTGNWTIGIGHNLTAKGISKGVMEMMFAEDVREAQDTLTKLVPDWRRFNEPRQNALVELAFNMGGKLASFAHMLRAVNSDDWDRAADELQDSLWFRQVGRRGPRLVRTLRTGQD